MTSATHKLNKKNWQNNSKSFLKFICWKSHYDWPNLKLQQKSRGVSAVAWALTAGCLRTRIRVVSKQILQNFADPIRRHIKKETAEQGNRRNSSSTRMDLPLIVHNKSYTGSNHKNKPDVLRKMHRKWPLPKLQQRATRSALQSCQVHSRSPNGNWAYLGRLSEEIPPPCSLFRLPWKYIHCHITGFSSQVVPPNEFFLSTCCLSCALIHLILRLEKTTDFQHSMRRRVYTCATPITF